MTNIDHIIQKIVIIVYIPIILFGVIFSIEAIKEYIRERAAEKKNRIQYN